MMATVAPVSRAPKVAPLARAWTGSPHQSGCGQARRAPKGDQHSRNGLSLLEVMLAIAILGGSIVAIGELIRIGTLSAANARDLTQAQLLCESKINEVLTGGAELNAVTTQQFDPTVTPGSEEWTYSIEVGQTDYEGVMSVRVTVQQDASKSRPVSFSLSAWMMDPEIEYAQPEEEEGASGGAAGGATGGTGGI